MNPAYIGDSYDIVKRFFCATAHSIRYAVYVEPMFTGDWTSSQRTSFFRFIGARRMPAKGHTTPAALLIDPDKGVRAQPGPAHTTFATIAHRCQQFELVIVFDQSFARGPRVRGDLGRKLLSLRQLGVRGLYYNSHARFLICGKGPGPPMRFRKSLIEAGLPAQRFVGLREPAD
jgi:hypothetical protein